MAAPAVAAVAKKVAAYVITDKKARKIVIGIILGIIVILSTPIIAIVAFLNGDMEIDTNRLQTLVVQNLSAEEQARLQTVEDTMLSIETEMTSAGFSGKVKDAQVLYVLALSEQAEQSDFVSKLVGCFTTDQTDEQLINTVNSTFGTAVSLEEFQNVMGGIRRTTIDTSGYTDLATKNNLDLVQWAIAAKNAGWGYVYGTYGTVLDESLLTSKLGQYPDEVGSYEQFIRDNWLGGRTADCVGLIKGYGWYDTESKTTTIGANSMADVGADTMYENATEKGTIDTIPETPGLAVWHEGHIGIYIGGGEVIHAAGTTSGVIQNNINDTAWTHWLKIPYITYKESE